MNYILIHSCRIALIYTKLISVIRSPTEELGRTEVVRDNLHPEWAAQIVVTYIFEVQQTLIVKVRQVCAQSLTFFSRCKIRSDLLKCSGPPITCNHIR